MTSEMSSRAPGAESPTPQMGPSWIFFNYFGGRSGGGAMPSVEPPGCVEVAPILHVRNHLPRMVGTLECTGGTGLCWWGLQLLMGGNGRRPAFEMPGIRHHPVPAGADDVGGWEPSSRKRASGKGPWSSQGPSVSFSSPPSRFRFLPSSLKASQQLP